MRFLKKPIPTYSVVKVIIDANILSDRQCKFVLKFKKNTLIIK